MAEQLQLVNGLGYKPGTVRELIRVLDSVRSMQKRVTVYYGEPSTGEAWHSETGYVRPNGARRPQIVAHRNSEVGATIETDTVVRVEFANKKDGGELWRSK